MRKLLAGVWLIIAIAALGALVAVAMGVPVRGGERPMLFARALVLSVGLFVITLRWRRRPSKRMRK